MAHIEFKFIPLNTFPSDSEQQIGLDCWRVRLIFKCPEGITFRLDDVPWTFLGPEDADDLPSFQQLEVGGAYLNGRPINVKHTLTFTMPPGATAYAMLVLEYFVE